LQPPQLNQVQAALAANNHPTARALLLQWLRAFALGLAARPPRRQLRQPELWDGLVEHARASGDRSLIERYWQLLDRLAAPAPPAGGLPALPLLGIPILNRADLLQRLLDSLDHPVQVLAIVDNSPHTPAQGSLNRELEALRQRGHPLIDQIRIARPFSNLGVAASWNLILSSFPEAPLALLANNDVRFAPGVLAAALERIDAGQAQFLPLLPSPHAFAAFLLTCRCWDLLGLFDANFHPAYCEDLDYRDRLNASAAVEQLDGSFAHAAMAALNGEHSATIHSNPELQRHNRTSYALNRLWYLSERRLQRDPRGSWRRLWLSQWRDDDATPA
jgi:hypothetical protein